MLKHAIACILAVYLGAAPPAESPAPRGKDAGRQEWGLRYRIQMHLRGEASPLETRFTVVPTPARTTRNHVKKPRLGGWRLEADRAVGTDQPLLMARAERMLYLSGPAPQTVEEPYVLRFGGSNCPVWRVELPLAPASRVYGFLVEVAPNLLALCDLQASFDSGEVASVEMHLESFRLKPGTVPPEDGTSLLATLQRWVAKPAAGAFPGVAEPAEIVSSR